MIYVGVTGWGDHDLLYPQGISSGSKLKEYSGHFPIVELDASFYAIQPQRNNEKWIRETPDVFKFIIKAYQGMTGHQRGDIPFDSKEEMFAAFQLSISPYIEAGKLAMVLFQFPPWFSCKKENVEYLRWCKQQMGDIPCALEFRHQSWFKPEYYERTLSFMKEENWIHSICDEPQAGEGSIPAILVPTNSSSTLVRLHGRNVHGWNKTGSDEHWREVRYLYQYNRAELEEWAQHALSLQKSSEHVFILFNNNSGGDAAANAKQMIQLLGVEYNGLGDRQLDMFDE
ncbi:DUF72 domain-containing protein [Bacillus lacus]|uniref:DUF72 domain-containing protein n=1 Tax=Metabacillus lacus TaxID=1983721 RepID=A0A7X2LWZ3_9BACI|nr:DUF72 domain-containing protein [Metabacillus lacus]MRX72005.1 DUF72 domain-containing protein [Metabacillus lacus]